MGQGEVVSVAAVISVLYLKMSLAIFSVVAEARARYKEVQT
jgi:hypothetical protein